MTIRQRLAAVNATAIRLKNEGRQRFRQIYTFSLCNASVFEVVIHI